MSDEFVFTDDVLDSFLVINSKMDFERHSCKVRADLPPENAILECEKWIRRRAVRRSDYEKGEIAAPSRETLSWTWMEEKIISWAFTKSAETRPGVEVTTEYIAQYLRRSVAEVEEKKNTKHTRHGIKGFF